MFSRRTIIATVVATIPGNVVLGLLLGLPFGYAVFVATLTLACFGGLIVGGTYLARLIDPDA